MKRTAPALGLSLALILFLTLALPFAAKAEEGLRVLDIGERTYENGPALAVILSAPLDPEKRYDDFLRVSDPQKMVKGAWILAEDRRTLYFPHVEPETVYSVSVIEGLTAADGQKLTRRAFKAVLTRKVVAAVSFASDGLVLPGKLAEGLPVAAVNVAEVEIEFFRMNEKGLKDYVRWQRPNSRHDYHEIMDAGDYGEFVYSGRWKLDPPRNRRVVKHVPVMEVEELQKPGVYLAVMREPGEYGYEYKATYFIVTDIGLHARIYPDEALIYASSLKTGEPIDHVGVTLYDEKAKPLARGFTDAEGAFRFESSVRRAKVSYIQAEKDGQVAVLPLGIPALDLGAFDLTGRPWRAQEAFLYSPRDLYRPGEVVTVSALLRDYDGRAVKSLPLSARLFRPDGRKVRSFTWQPEDSAQDGPGYYQTELDIDGGAQTGMWRLEVRDNPAGPPAGVFHFQVEDFMPERMKLELASDQDHLAPGQAFSVKLDGQYLYGAPAAGNRVEAQVRARPEREPIKDLDGYVFGQVDEMKYREYWDAEPLELDERGQGTLSVEDRWKGVTTPVSVRVTASLFETGGRPVNRSIERVYWPAGRLVGIRPLFENNAVDEGMVSFEVLAAGPDGKTVPAEGLLATLTKEDRDYYWEYSESRGWEHKYTEKRYVIEKDVISADGQNAAQYKKELGEGWYVLAVRDPQTGLSSTYRFQVGYWWYGHDRALSARPDEVTLELDQPAYLPGDVARLTIKPPHSGDARVLVEGRSPLWAKRLPVSDQGTTVDIPISAAWDSHDLYVSVVVFRPGQAEEKITPNRAIGVVHLPLAREQRKLEIAIEAPEKVSPQKPTDVAMKVQLNRKPDKPVWVTLAAVDVGILSITDFKTPDPFGWFFARRRYNPDQYDMYGKVIELMDTTAAAQSCGGDADTTPGGKRPETKVKLLTLFNAPVSFDENGAAEIVMTMPHDFNGRVRLMALAYGEDAFGSAETEMTVAAPIVTQLSTPRLMAPGDEALFTLDVHNLSGMDQNVELDLTATEPLKLSDGRRTVPLKDGEKTTLTYSVRAGDGFAPSIIDLGIKAEGVEMKRDWQLGIRPAYPAVARMVRRVLRPGETFNLDPAIAADMMASGVEAGIKVSPTLPINMRDAMHGLISYPYGCLEQTSSRAYPLLYATPDRITRLGLAPIAQSERIKRLETAMDKLSGMQTRSGGFALWPEGGPEVPWLTAYVTDFMLQARDQGLVVSPQVLAKALHRLEQYVQKGVKTQGDRHAQAQIDFAIRAYSAYVLARVNRAPLGTLRTYFDQNKDKAGSSLPLAHMGLALKMMGDQVRSGMALMQASTTRREGYAYWGDYGSPVRDLVLTTALLIENKIDVPGLEKLMVEIDDQLRSRRWFSTQERFALFKLGMALEELAGRKWQAELTTAGRKTELDQEGAYVFGPTAQDIASGIAVRNGSESILFVSAVVNGYTKTPPPADQTRMLLKKEFYTFDGKKVENFRFHVGDLLLVHLTVEADLDIPDALVVDLLPSTFEIENPNLKYSVKLDDAQLEDIKIEDEPFWRLSGNTHFQHREYRDDRYAAAVNLYKGQRAHLFYLVRVVTPGGFDMPPVLCESMYRPEIRGVSETPGRIQVENQNK